MVLTSLSLHVIALVIWLLAGYFRSSAGSGSGNESEPPGPVVILSKVIAPEPPSHPPTPAASRPPPKPPVVAAKSVPPPQPARDSSVSAEEILAGHGGPHLNGGVVFLLDISGSMDEAYAGATRLALARKLIYRQIEALPNGTPFAIALYGETTLHSGPLIAANPATRTAAEQYLATDFDCGGGTNLSAGLDTAEYLHPACIVLVTDGSLNVANDKLMKDARRILGRPGPQLSVFGVAPRPGTGDEELLQNLVHQQAGSYQSMDVPGATNAPAPTTPKPPGNTD
jgi:hypothetical protein